MALLIHVPRKEKSVAIIGYDTLADLISHPNSAIRQLSMSQYTLIRNFGYAELISKGEYSLEQLTDHMQDYDSYISVADELDMDATDPLYEEIEDKLNDILMSDEFHEKYDIVYNVITRELFRAFACGAVAHEEQDVGVGKMPSQLNSVFGAQA